MAEDLKVVLIKKEGTYTNNETGEVKPYHNYNVRVPVNGSSIDVKLQFDDKITKQVLDTITNIKTETVVY